MSCAKYPVRWRSVSSSPELRSPDRRTRHISQVPYEQYHRERREKDGVASATNRWSSTEPTLSQMHVTVEWMDRELGVPLEQLEPLGVSDETEQAITDWHYWLNR